MKWGPRAKLNMHHRRDGNNKLILHTSDPVMPFLQAVLLLVAFFISFFLFVVFLVLKMTKHFGKAGRQKYGKGKTVRHIVIHSCVRYQTGTYPCHKPAQVTNRGG